jgi:dTDP-glucose 4,6-dehydratase
MAILITGGAGFIGSNFIIDWLETSNELVINLDKLSYAGNLENLSCLDNDPRHKFIQGDICDRATISSVLNTYHPRAILNFAAESHVDRSIHGPEDFIQTNILGAFNLLDETRKFWNKLDQKNKNEFVFLHVSTDEVYGSLKANDPAFCESNRYEPNSPYSASKASSDHLVRSYHHTYGLPTIITNCSNNYGAFQFPEKLIPLIIHNALSHKTLPIYGDGQQIRDWLYVSDHCRALKLALQSGTPGEVYNIGGLNEKTNLEIVEKICLILDRKLPRTDGLSYKEQIQFVEDRPGHDRRYAVNADKIQEELKWSPQESFESGIEKTVQWYLDNQLWVKRVISGDYRDWVKRQYA